MTNLIIFLTMIFMHIFADFNLQGWLAQSKQKSFWTKTMDLPDGTKGTYIRAKYQNDWIPCILAHSFAWTFCVMIVPTLVWKLYTITDITKIICFAIIFVLNLIIHAVTDNAKCNQGKINLVGDQLIHIVQIIITFFALM